MEAACLLGITLLVDLVENINRKIRYMPMTTSNTVLQPGSVKCH
jgi:hypothetical protein